MSQEEIREYIKCYQDPVYYLNNYGYVFDLEKKLIGKLSLYEFQVPVVRDYVTYTNNIILKSRQQGLSVITAGYVAYLLMFGTDERILIIANDYKGAKRFVDSVKIFLDNAPKWMLPDERVVDNQNELKFSNGCSLKAVASSPQAGRGEALTLLILDETAFIEHADDIWMGAGIALSVTGGKCIMISTPYGTGNLYHRTWVEAVKAKEELEKPDSKAEYSSKNFNPIRVHWATHPVLSKGLEWRTDEFGIDRPWSPWYEGERKRLEYDNVKISQELDLSFEGSKNLVIDNVLIDRFKAKIKNKIISYFDHQKTQEKFVNYPTGFKIWHLPEKNIKYIIGADVARGDGSDFSTIQVIDALNLRQVAEYSAKIAPDQFAKVIRDIAIEYNMAYVAVECNSFGLVTSLKLKNDLKYPADKIFHSKTAVQLFNKDWKMEIPKNEDIPGWQTTTKTRPLLIATLQKYMREGEIEINSEILLDEFKTFVYTTAGKSGEPKPQHAPGYHDDLIFALAIALVMRDTEFQNTFWSADNVKAMMEGIQVKHSSFEVNKIQSSNGSHSKKEQEIEDDDLTWLYGPIKG
jgi:hypothetical protein